MRGEAKATNISVGGCNLALKERGNLEVNLFPLRARL